MSTFSHITESLRGRLNAGLLNRADDLLDSTYGRRKKGLFTHLPQRIVEIGPGPGANLRYYRPGTHLTAVEPNVRMHPYLRDNARRQGVELELRQLQGEAVDLGDGSVEAVVGTLVLCTVDDPQRVLAEIRRILTPGGRYLFLEHVAALANSRLRRVQNTLHAPWHWLAEGCHLNRNTHELIWRSGFSNVEMDCFELGGSWLPVSPHIIGEALR